MSKFNSGDKVTHARFGEGVIISIDSKTYSIEFVLVRVDVGEIYRPSNEFKPYEMPVWWNSKNQKWEKVEIVEEPVRIELTGPDASIEESLYFYGQAWHSSETELTLVYGINQENGRYILFDRQTFDLDYDITDDFSDKTLSDVASCSGWSVSEWMEGPLPERLFDINGYCGLLDYPMRSEQDLDDRFLTVSDMIRLYDVDEDPEGVQPEGVQS